MISPRRRYALALPSGSVLELGARTLVMGILNVTPDSFADGGVHLDPGLAIAAALQLEADGADIVDIGGESTRPGAEALSTDAEIFRVLPVVEGVASKIGVPVSIDTYKAEVARLAIDSGASIVNDVSGLSYDPALAGVVAAAGVPIVLTHNRGRSQEMYREAHYVSTPNEVERELGGAIERAMLAGISREQIVVDPGLGFAKRAEHTFSTLANIDAFRSLDRPILVGPSRKSFLDDALGERPPADREWGTAAAVASAVLLGAHIVRVHGVRQMADVVRVADHVAAARDTEER